MRVLLAAMAFLVSVSAAWLSAATAQQAGGWVSADYVQGRLAGGGLAEGKDNLYHAAIDIRLAEGWHAYWRMPGDGGLPPRFDWQGSENLAGVGIGWPVPERFETYGLHSFGYKGNVLLPLEVRAIDPQKPVLLRAAAQIMVCKDVCVPQKIDLALGFETLKAGADNARIAAALATVPHKGDLPELKIDSAVAGDRAIVVNAFAEKGFDSADLYVESGDVYVTARPAVKVDAADPRRAMITVAAPEGFDGFAGYIMARPLTLTLVAGGAAIEKTINF